MLIEEPPVANEDDFADLNDLDGNFGTALPPPRKRKRSSKGGTKTKSVSAPFEESQHDSSLPQLNVVIAVLCILHVGNIGFFSWSYFVLSFKVGVGFQSLISLANMVVGVASVVAGVGILNRASWSVDLAEKAAIAFIALLGISVVTSGVSLVSAGFGSSLLPYLVTTILRQASIPAIVLWWSTQNPEL
ncbi:MAG: hypothetical protein ABGZ17_17615 [Planctomycetaceae bacterium]